VERAYSRALAICREVGNTPDLFPVLIGLWRFYLTRAKHDTAHELAQQLLSLAQHSTDAELLLEAHRPPGQTFFCFGELVKARSHLEEAIALYDRHRHRSHAFIYGHDAGVTCRAFGALALWLLGYPGSALERSHQALGTAHGLSHPPSLAFALAFAVLLHQWRREFETAQKHVSALVTLSTQHEFRLWEGFGTILRGWTLTMQARADEGIEQIEQGLDAWRATGSELYRPYFLALLAEACWKRNDVEAGLRAIAEAMDMIDENRERVWEAELHRLRGELLLARRASEEPAAELCFQRAIEVARSQGAKSWELRAATSLGHLWKRQGRIEEAERLLSDVYGWFSEGFDTADLADAKLLLHDPG
jgi:predicted ATPase